MQILHCATCDTSPLEAPRLVGGIWYAQCPGCLADNVLEPDYSNVFLPVKFRVAAAPTPPRRAERAETGSHPTP